MRTRDSACREDPPRATACGRWRRGLCWLMTAAGGAGRSGIPQPPPHENHAASIRGLGLCMANANPTLAAAIRRSACAPGACGVSIVSSSFLCQHALSPWPAPSISQHQIATDRVLLCVCLCSRWSHRYLRPSGGRIKTANNLSRTGHIVPTLPQCEGVQGSPRGPVRTESWLLGVPH